MSAERAAAPPGGGEGAALAALLPPAPSWGGGAAGAEPPPPALPCPQTPLRFTRVEGEEGELELLRQSVAASWKLGLGPRGEGGDRKE